MKRSNRRPEITSQSHAAESLELRLCLSSVGWDGAGQGSASLTYYVGDVPADFSLSQSQVEAAIATALQTWSDVIDVTFTQTSIANLRDSIDIEFGNIDGAGGTLAQAYFPDDVNPAVIAGDVLVDISETWEIGNQLGSAAFDLVYVMVHELGHSLGLDHAASTDSVMYPSVSPNQQFTALSAGDVDVALALYAAAEVAPVDPNAGIPAETPTDSGNDIPDVPAEQTPTEDPPGDPLPSPQPTDPTEVPNNRGDNDGDEEDAPDEEAPTEEPPVDDSTNPDDDNQDDDDTDEPPTEEEPQSPKFGDRWVNHPFQRFSPRTHHGSFGHDREEGHQETSPLNHFSGAAFSPLARYIRNRHR